MSSGLCDVTVSTTVENGLSPQQFWINLMNLRRNGELEIQERHFKIKEMIVNLVFL